MNFQKISHIHDFRIGFLGSLKFILDCKNKPITRGYHTIAIDYEGWYIGELGSIVEYGHIHYEHKFSAKEICAYDRLSMGIEK